MLASSLLLAAGGLTLTDNNNKNKKTCHMETRSDKNNPGLALTGLVSHPQEVKGPVGIPSRAEQLRRLKDPATTYDVLVIGGGATGAGVAFDAASRGLSVACVERGDFGSETSSRSTKLIWAGIKYLATASAGLLSLKFFSDPLTTILDFKKEIEMVSNCHRERRYMTDNNPHLTNWVPIAVPFDRWWVGDPPPFGHWLFGFFPVLAPFVFKFYDGMSAFSCPPSYVMGKKASREKFPQLNDRDIKYCAVFYEAQHNDARTNVAIAMSAAESGAHIANYVEMKDVIRDDKTNKVVGIHAVDRATGASFTIHAKHVVFAGGPFTDSLREIEDATSAAKPVVRGAAGTHVVLPGYYSPSDMGLLDYNTSDGRFLFFLPWQGHTLVGTTDRKCDAATLPVPPEDEVQWILNECSTYLNKDMNVRRSDVLSAWRGWRPLAMDPNAAPDAPASRDHVISVNQETGVTFVAGGKWTTWREMAQEVVDGIVGEDGPKCVTLERSLHGREGYSNSLPIKLIQKHGIAEETANHLSNTYGGRSWEVCEIHNPTFKRWPRYGVPLVVGYPYTEAEVVYACREYACTIEDVLSRRTRLAFLNREAAEAALPKVADIMAQELGWSRAVKKRQIEAATKYLESYGGRIPNKQGATLRSATYVDIAEVFRTLDTDGSGYLDRQEVSDAAKTLGFPLTEKELDAAYKSMDKDRNGRVSLEEFEMWWNNDKDHSKLHTELQDQLKVGGKATKDLKDMGVGGFFG